MHKERERDREREREREKEKERGIITHPWTMMVKIFYAEKATHYKLLVDY